MSLKVAAFVIVLINFVAAKTVANGDSSQKTFVWAFDSRNAATEQQAKIFSALQDSMKDNPKLNFKAVDCTKKNDECKFVKDKSSSSYFIFEGDKLRDVYHGAQDLNSLKSFCMSQLSEKSLRSLPADASNATQVFNVPLLTYSNFYEEIRNPEQFTFVMFYAPWCKHCKKFKPFWNILNDRYLSNDTVKIRAVDCVAEQKSRLCFRNNVDGFPTMYLYKGGKNLGEYEGGKNIKQLEKFINNRIVAFNTSQLQEEKKQESLRVATAKRAADQKAEEDKPNGASCVVTEAEHEMCVPEWARS